MVLPAIIGAAALAGGSIMNQQAAGRKERALGDAMAGGQQAMDQVNAQQAELSGDREGLLQGLMAARRPQLDQTLATVAGRGAGLAEQTGLANEAILQGIGEARGLAPQLQQPGGAAAAQARQFAVQQMMPLQDAQRGVIAGQIGRNEVNAAQGDAFQDLRRTEEGLASEQGSFERKDFAPRQAQIDLDRLLAQISLQEALQGASQVGGRTQAFGGLLQQVGGGLLGGF